MSTGRTANQPETLDAIMMFSSPFGDPSVHPTLPDPGGMMGTLDERARTYLHTNCAQCHRPGGPTPSSMDLRVTASLAETQTCDVAPTSGDLGITDPLLVAPGDPDRSVLLERMNRRGAVGEMPPLGSALVDDAGVMLIRDWIEGLTAC